MFCVLHCTTEHTCFTFDMHHTVQKANNWNDVVFLLHASLVNAFYAALQVHLLSKRLKAWSHSRWLSVEGCHQHTTSTPIHQLPVYVARTQCLAITQWCQMVWATRFYQMSQNLIPTSGIKVRLSYEMSLLFFCLPPTSVSKQVHPRWPNAHHSTSLKCSLCGDK